MKSVLIDLGYTQEYAISIDTDSTAALGMCNRNGIGEVRRLGRRLLWVQQRHAYGDLSINKIPGTDSESVILTKHVSQKRDVDSSCKRWVSNIGTHPADQTPRRRVVMTLPILRV